MPPKMKTEWNYIPTKKDTKKNIMQPKTQQPKTQHKYDQHDQHDQHNQHKHYEQIKPIYVNKKYNTIDEAKKDNFEIQVYVYNHIKKLYSENDIITAIKLVKRIGTTPIDTIMCLANLFCYVAKVNNISDMQTIIEHIAQIDTKLVDYIINAQVRNYTPLMYAAYNIAPDSIKFLINNGADLSIKNMHNEGVLDAVESGLKAILEKNGEISIFKQKDYEEIHEYIKFWTEKGEKILTGYDVSQFLTE